MLRRYVSALLTPSVVFGALGVALLLGVASVWLLWNPGPAAAPRGKPTAILDVTPWATSTRLPTTTPTIAASQTPEWPPTLAPGEIGIGSIVQIVGTQGVGLNIRSEAGLSSQVFFLAYDAEVFEVGDGPVEVDGFVWWYLVTPLDKARSGWAAAEYLDLVTNP